jgi:hypothetical protein
MKKLLFVFVLLLATCQPSEQTIQTAIANTQAAIPSETNTPGPTNTPLPSNTPLPKATPYPTTTPVPSYTPIPTNTPFPKLGSMDNPVPLGKAEELTKGGEIDFTIRVTKSIRGKEAWDAISNANMFNEDVKNPEQEYLLVNFEVEYLSGPRDKALQFGIFEFGSLSDGNILARPFAVVVPEPDFDKIFSITSGGIFRGHKGAGWMDFYAWIIDDHPMVYLGKPGTDNVWYFEVK